MVESEGGGVGMVGTDEGGMEGTNGGMLDLITICCRPMLVSPPCHGVSTLSRIIVASSLHLLAMLLLSCVVVLVPYRCPQLIVVPSCISMK